MHFCHTSSSHLNKVYRREKNSGKHLKGTVERRRSPRVHKCRQIRIRSSTSRMQLMNDLLLYLHCYNESATGKGLQTSRKRHWPIAKQVCNSRDHAEICCKLCQLNCKSAIPQDWIVEFSVIAAGSPLGLL